MKPVSYKRHRFPPKVIRYVVWQYFRFTLSLRDVEELLAERRIVVSYETIRCWTVITHWGGDVAVRRRRSFRR
jgi:putative transposase